MRAPGIWPAVEAMFCAVLMRPTCRFVAFSASARGMMNVVKMLLEEAFRIPSFIEAERLFSTLLACSSAAGDFFAGNFLAESGDIMTTREYIRARKIKICRL